MIKEAEHNGKSVELNKPMRGDVKKYGFIYMLINNINNKKYIGQTIQNLDYRINRHFNNLKNNSHYNVYLQREYNIYGSNNFTVKILKSNVSSLSELNELEIQYIRMYNTCNNNYGYNLMGGGNNVSLHDSTKQKISDGLLNNEKITKPIIQYDLNNGNIIKEWISAYDIKRKLNYSAGNIHSCCKQHEKYSHAYGFGWRYNEDYELGDFKLYELNSKKFKPIVGINGEEKHIFNSIKEAMHFFSFQRKFIQRVLSGERNKYKGWSFKYV